MASGDRSFQQAPLQSRDRFLSILVLLAELGGIRDLSLTLNVGGLIISGQLISTSAYFKATMDLLRDALEQQGGELRSVTLWDNIVSPFGQPPVTWADLRAILDTGGDVTSLLTSQIHLRNARMYAPDLSREWSVRTLWRGPLEAVDGFFIGEVDVRLA